MVNEAKNRSLASTSVQQGIGLEMQQRQVELLARAVPGVDDVQASTTGPGRFVTLAAGAPDDPVLLMVHPLGGEIGWYRSLARGVRRGFHVEALAGSEALADVRTMDELISAYGAQVSAQFAGRTVVLCGWSYGGILALLVGSALAPWVDLAEVIMIDPLIIPEGMALTPNFGLLVLTNGLLMRAGEKQLWLDDLAALGAGAPDLTLWRTVVRERRGFTIPFEDREFDALRRKSEHQHELLAGRCGPWPDVAARVTTVWASQCFTVSPKYDWRRHGRLAGNEYVLDADHYSVLARPELRDILDARLTHTLTRKTGKQSA
ncbi:MAG TPA: alpha/beta fold hydrolase [Polyangiales bacterium]